ncbi:lipopolysaccharide-induced tumor necrosis factor-alpha factor homolog isoform 2-T2 [Pholidichthys leucotaenia]
MYLPPCYSPCAPPPGTYQPGFTAPCQPCPRVVVGPLQEVPAPVKCPYCNQEVVTAIDYAPGLLAWFVCGGLALIGCCLCSWIPFCVDSFKDVEHYCPSCKRVIHIYKRIK